MLMHQLLLQGAERTPNRPAWTWVDRRRTFSYAEAVDAMECMAGALGELGVVKGDRVTIFAHNGMDYLAAMFGAWRIGAIAALVNVKFANELAYYLADHSPKVVIYTHDMVQAVTQAVAAVPGIRHLVCMDGEQPGAQSLPELMKGRLPAPPDPWDERAIAHLSYTSGTTGKPKGACLAHEPTVTAARCIAERLRVGRDDVSFGPTALSSSYQLVANLLPPLAQGAHLHVMRFWDPAAGWEALEQSGATLLIANPTLLEDLLDESARRGRAPQRLRLGLSGGGPVPPTLKSGWRDALRLPLVESFGQSELGGFMAMGLPELEPDNKRLLRVGPALPDKEVRIVDAQDRPVPTGTVGEIVLRGGFMAGYWERAEKTAESTRGGWLRTGDLGLIDEEGFVTMRGRRAELIKVGDQAWFPRDVEEALCRQAGVRQAAVIGIADEVLGARPLAFVTAREGAQIDPSQLKDAIRDEVDLALDPLTIELLTELPMTPTGKIAKAELASRQTSSSR
ncbi:MAG: acyl--CoA ligase [Proteobacteria bacterium]|nr:acyl--CoA ligase [Pseudomonadota bacterium]